jgi:hypothetical protein
VISISWFNSRVVQLRPINVLILIVAQLGAKVLVSDQTSQLSLQLFVMLQSHFFRYKVRSVFQRCYPTCPSKISYIKLAGSIYVKFVSNPPCFASGECLPTREISRDLTMALDKVR